MDIDHKVLEEFTNKMYVLIDMVQKLGDNRSHSNSITKHDLKETEKKIMSQITDWAAKNQADLTAIGSTLDGIVAGVAALDTLITNLQNSPGTLSASDQSALDAIQASADALVTKSAGIVVTPPA